MENIINVDTATLVFVGIAISLAITFIKSLIKKAGYDTNTSGSMFIVVAVSLLGAGVYTALVHFGFLEAFIKLITIAGAFYAYIIKNVKDTSKNDGEISEV